MSALTMVDLFSGIGGFSLAGGWAGFETVLFCEIDPFCQAVLRKHWPAVPIVDDITWMMEEYLDDEYGQPTLITAGFPCQPHSVLGKRRGTGDTRDLWPDTIRIISELHPPWFVGENVPGIITTILDDCLDALEAEGYEARTYVLPANIVGAEHRRERVFIVAHDSGQRIQGLRPDGFKVTRSLGQTLLPLRDSDGEWQVEPCLRRAHDGLPGRMDRQRVKALGNAIVPQVAYPILQAIADIEMAA